MLLTKDQALKVSKRVFATVFVPELDGELRLCGVSAAVTTGIQELNSRRKAGENVAAAAAALLLEKSIVDEKGELLFDAAGAADFFAKISPESFETIATAIPGWIKKTPPEAPPAVPSEGAPVVA